MAHTTWSACSWCHSQDHTPNTESLLRKKVVGGFYIQDSRSRASQAFPRHALLPWLERAQNCLTGAVLAGNFGFVVGLLGEVRMGALVLYCSARPFRGWTLWDWEACRSWAESRCCSPPNRISSPVKWMRTLAPGRLQQTAVPPCLPWSACHRLCPQRVCLPNCMQLGLVFATARPCVQYAPITLSITDLASPPCTDKKAL